MKLYISGPALAIVGLYLLLVLSLLRRSWGVLPSRPWIRLAIVSAVFTFAAAIPLWDVVFTSVAMARHCPDVGVFVHRSVKVDGYLTDWGSPELLKHGFKYIEERQGRERIVEHVNEHGIVRSLDHLASRYEPKSRYESRTEADDRHIAGPGNVTMSKTVARDRLSQEELGRAVMYYAYPGWVDRQTVGRLGQLSWTCPSHRPEAPLDLQSAVFVPN